MNSSKFRDHYKFYINGKLEYAHLPVTYKNTELSKVLEEFIESKSFKEYIRVFNVKKVVLAEVRDNLTFEIIIA